MSGIQIGTSDVINSNREFDNITGADGKYDGLHGRLVGSLSGNAINMSVPMTRHVMTGDATFTLTGISPGATCMLLLDRSADLHTPTFPSAISFPTNPTWENWRYWQIVLTCPRGTQVTGNAIGFLWSGVNGEAPGGASIDATFSRPGGWLYSNKQAQYPQSQGDNRFTAVSIYFAHDADNNRILVRFSHSDSETLAVHNDVFINYTNLTNISDIRFMYKYADIYAQWNHDGGSETPNVNSPQNFNNWHNAGPLPEYDDRSAGTDRGAVPNEWHTFYPSTFNGTSLGGSYRRLVWKAGSVQEPLPGVMWQSRVGVAWGSSISDNLSIRVTCDEGQFISTCDLGSADTVGNTSGASATDPVSADIELLALAQAPL